MIIGVPKEIKADENRVSLTPSGVHEFVKRGHRVMIEINAGTGSGFSDAEYAREGAVIIDSAQEIFRGAEMIIKVKEPQPVEVDMLRKGQVLYTFLHLAPEKELTTRLLEKNVTAIAYETIEADGKLVCLEPMSEIAGKISAIMGAYYLAKPYGGKGILAGGVAGVHSANFLILGGGTAGINAARVAAGLGARIMIMDINLDRMRYLEDVLPNNCETIMSNRLNIGSELPTVDVIIGSVLVRGARTPKLITRGMLAMMRPGTVLIDISIDQGGCFETSRPTTHSSPVFEIDKILHYCVANMPGAYPRSSTFALTNATLPFGLALADLGWKEAARANQSIAMGINCTEGSVTCQPVADAHSLPCRPIEDIISS